MPQLPLKELLAQVAQYFRNEAYDADQRLSLFTHARARSADIITTTQPKKTLPGLMIDRAFSRDDARFSIFANIPERGTAFWQTLRTCPTTRITRLRVANTSFLIQRQPHATTRLDIARY